MRFLVLIGALASSLFAQTDWRFAHPDATLVGGLRPQAVLDSPFLASALAEATKKEPSAAMALGMAKGLLGGVTEVRFSVQDNGGKEPDVLALVSGRLDDAFMRSMAQDKAKWQRIDANTVLMGNGASLEKAAARMRSAGTALQSRVLDGVDTLAGYDFWLAGNIPESPMTAGLKMNLKGIAFGINVHDALQLELAARTATAAQAEALLKSAHEAETSQAPQFRGMLQSFVEGTTARFRVNVPKEIVLQAMEQRQASAVASASASPRPTPIAPASAAPTRKTIIIDGLDNGPKEIPLQK
jgi:hypothetical protein